VPVPFSAVLIANRGEIAIRIANACADLGVRSVGVFAEDDQHSLHTRQVDEAVALPGRGVPAYLDGAQLIAVAREQGCEAIHPGYGFLAENAEFAEQCEAAGLTLIGPGAETLRVSEGQVSHFPLRQVYRFICGKWQTWPSGYDFCRGT